MLNPTQNPGAFIVLFFKFCEYLAEKERAYSLNVFSVMMLYFYYPNYRYSIDYVNTLLFNV